MRLENTRYFEGWNSISLILSRAAVLTDYFPKEGCFSGMIEAVTSEADSLLKSCGITSRSTVAGDILPQQVEVCWSLKEILQRNSLSLVALTAFSAASLM